MQKRSSKTANRWRELSRACAHTVARFFAGVVYPSGSIAIIRRGPLKGRRYVVCDETGYAPILGRWEPAMTQLHMLLVQPGEIVYDLGANTGIHSLLFSDLVGINGRVFAFEPVPANVGLLEQLQCLNDLTNLEIVPSAVSDSVGETSFKLGRDGKQGSLVGIGCESGEEEIVRTTTLDAFIANGGLPPDILKVDIEGAEGAALRGFAAGIAHDRPTFVIELHNPENDRIVADILNSFGYRLYRLRDSVAIRHIQQRDFLELIPDVTSTWPDPKGVWGTIAALHPNRWNELAVEKLNVMQSPREQFSRTRS